MLSAPAIKDVVLLGGGHSHALLLRQWAMKPVDGIRLTLISRDVLTPYSGMLPGYISGHYSSDDIHIDLSRVCRWAGIRFIEATITGLDTSSREVQLEDRPSVGYDCLSIDTGSTPDQTVPGSAEHSIAVKPIHQFQEQWHRFLAAAEKQGSSQTGLSHAIGVVGSGVGGFELLLAIHHAMQRHGHLCQMHWVLRGDRPMRRHPEKARQMALDACQQRGIDVHAQFDVAEVRADRLLAVDGRELTLDSVFWVTAAAAPDWPAEAGLQTDARGFIATNKYLQSISHAEIFASGDIGTQLETPADKAGVFAVRQAPVLSANLIRFVLHKPLQVYRPQKNFLSLMALGGREAIASRNGLAVAGAWVWRWKDHIDRSFMRQFVDLPPRHMAARTLSDVPLILREQAGLATEGAELRCGGCGAKMGGEALLRVLRQLKTVQRDDVVSGLAAANDAAVIRPQQALLAQSVDQFRAMLDDPWLLGRIAALHALNDIYAVQARPLSAMALVTLPLASTALQERDLLQLMSGAAHEFQAVACALTGGHTGEGAEMMIGFSINGLLDNQQSAAPGDRNLQPGDRLVLSKAIGSGVLLAADMQARATGVAMQSCIDSMLQRQFVLVDLMREYGVQAATDISGFGLLSHLQRLLSVSGLGCELNAAAIPLLPSALALSEQGIGSSLLAANRSVEQKVVNPEIISAQLLHLLSDPQTSGGLLMGIAEDRAGDFLADVQAAGFDAAAIIGRCRHSAGIRLV